MIKKMRKAVRVFLIKNNKVVCVKYKIGNIGYFDIPRGKIEIGETSQVWKYLKQMNIMEY